MDNITRQFETVHVDASGRAQLGRMLLSSKEAASLLGVSNSAFLRLGLPRCRLARRMVRYRLADILGLIERRLVQGGRS